MALVAGAVALAPASLAVSPSTPAARLTTATTAVLPGRAGLDSARLAAAFVRAGELPRLRSLLVAWRGVLVGERYFHGATRAAPANIKSASKSVISALVGVAIAEGRLAGLHQTIGELLPAETRGLDPEKRAITVGDLLTMRSGLETTSFESYGRWVASRNWVRSALERPLVARPGTEMIYSTGNTHLLSAILTRATGMSTHRFAQRALGAPLGIRIRPWTTDPQGIYFGGNEMRMTPRDMLALGRLYLAGGRSPAGRAVLPRGWVDSSWVPRGVSGWSGYEYGYGWWIRDAAGEAGRRYPVYFAWGYGGQYIFVVPDLSLVVVTTSDPNATTRERGHLDAIHALLDYDIIPAVGG
ncbi:MAG TPA: serine hydrolase [Gemmatimonadaceae bacterium]|nr:serine hydrolase [Gemmatimonadaceae bacterium]